MTQRPLDASGSPSDAERALRRLLNLKPGETDEVLRTTVTYNQIMLPAGSTVTIGLDALSRRKVVVLTPDGRTLSFTETMALLQMLAPALRSVDYDIPLDAGQSAETIQTQRDGIQRAAMAPIPPPTTPPMQSETAPSPRGLLFPKKTIDQAEEGASGIPVLSSTKQGTKSLGWFRMSYGTNGVDRTRQCIHNYTYERLPDPQYSIGETGYIVAQLDVNGRIADPADTFEVPGKNGEFQIVRSGRSQNQDWLTLRRLGDPPIDYEPVTLQGNDIHGLQWKRNLLSLDQKTVDALTSAYGKNYASVHISDLGQWIYPGTIDKKEPRTPKPGAILVDTDGRIFSCVAAKKLFRTKQYSSSLSQIGAVRNGAVVQSRTGAQLAIENGWEGTMPTIFVTTDDGAKTPLHIASVWVPKTG